MVLKKNQKRIIKEVVVGEHVISRENDGEIYVKVCNKISHPKYNTTAGVPVDYDFAILTLCKELTWTNNVAPVCLPHISDSASIYDGKEAIVAGWGYMMFEGSQKADTLKSITMKTMSNAECKKVMKDIMDKMKMDMIQMSPRQMCAINPYKDTCNGDSGGPLVVQKNGTQAYTLAGIASYGAPNCSTNLMGNPLPSALLG